MTRDFVTMLFSLYTDPPKSLVVGTLVEYCNSIARFFHELYGMEFSVAVKVLISPSEIVTIARDEVTVTTMRGRGDGDRVYRLEKNTAFYSLVSGDKKIFACDDLNSLAESLAYQNETPGWQDLYNSTACVPIRKSCVGNTKLFEMVGFLAVDCLPLAKSKPIFCRGSNPDEDVKFLLLGYADIMFAILKRGRPISNTMVQNRDGFVLDVDNFELIKELHETYANGGWQRVQSFHLNAQPQAPIESIDFSVSPGVAVSAFVSATFDPEI